MVDLKEQVKALMKQRSDIEDEISLSSVRLEAAGVGAKAPLVDNEGFPRADIDVHAARSDRNKIAVLSNDHKAITGKIETLLADLHAEVRQK